MNTVPSSFLMFKNFSSQRTPSGLRTSNHKHNHNYKYIKRVKRHHDIYWFRMGGLDHPYVQLRIHDTDTITSIVLSVNYKPLQLHSTNTQQYWCSQRKSYSPNGIPPSESTQKNLVTRLTTTTNKTSHRKYQTPTRSPMI